MLLFEHMGITLGAAALAAHSVKGSKTEELKKVSWFAPLSRYLDIRLLIIGSMLPDIIDKPIGEYFFVSTFNNGRIFAHTLLFLILLSAGGYYLYKRLKKRWLLTLAAGDFMHLALDEMWEVPRTFFWPLLGFHLPKILLTNWFANMLRALLSSPYIYISEIFGMAIIIWFGITLISGNKVWTFLRHGKLY